MNMADVVAFVERMNLAHHQSVIGPYFPDILALLSIVFGGSFLLFGWKHHEYYLGVTGLLVGAWAGLLLKNHAAQSGTLAPFIYVAVCATAGAFIGACCPRFVGILLGGFTVALFAYLFRPSLFRPGQQTLLDLCLLFLLGGGLGGLFPKFFYILNSSLIGSVFITYGLSLGILARLPLTSPQGKVFLHLLVFLPLFLFGLIYQAFSGRGAELAFVREAPAPARRTRPVRATVEVAE
ncbi:MAG: hypothetical protein HY716_03065 [Planctomycetes bacterium]|nr:hypothetical protein [Planctomycetota bacterium]